MKLLAAPLAFAKTFRRLILTALFLVVAILGLGIWPARYQSVFAQQVSPFAAPNYSHSSLPGTCILGGLNYTTDYAMLAYCIGTGGTYSYVPTVSNPVTTLNNIPQYTSTNGILSATGLAVAQTSTSNAIVQGNGTTIDQSWMPSVFPITVTNDGTTGTTNGLLAKINSAQHAIKLLTTDTAVQAYVVVTGGGTTGSARLAMTGTVTCTMEAAAGGTSGDYVTASSTTAGACHDAGSTPPTGAWVIGVLGNSPSSSGSGTVYILSGYYGSTGGGGGVTSVGMSVPTGFSVSPSTITSTGTFSITYANESSGVFLGGPCTGAATTPSWRSLCYSDLTSATYLQSPSFSASIAVDLSSGPYVSIALTGNTTLSISNAVAGMPYSFHLCQDSTGGRVVTWPAGVHGHMIIDSSAPASLCADQSFRATNSTTLYAQAPGVTAQ